MKLKTLVLTTGALAIGPVSTAWAGTITAEGNCTALTDYGEMGTLTGMAEFDEGPTSGSVPLTTYQAQGLVFKTGTLSTLLAGVTTPGSAWQPQYATPDNKYPQPIGGNGIQNGNTNRYAGVAIFEVTVTKFGLTASTNGTQYIDAWDESGNLVGQVKWQPSSDSSFVGIDCGNVPIKMISYGNDDLWNGATYGISGSTIYSDTWVWSGDTNCGNGMLDMGEECDDGNNVFTDDCTIGCKMPTCGDKFVWAGNETCDDGNADNTDDCLDTCEAPTCGDGYVWAGMEECDDGNMDDNDMCKNDCTKAGCGDGIVGPGEECDDGNEIATDGCTDVCKLPICGDGIVREFQEQCDDGNMDDTDSCIDCKEAYCGDGFVQAGVEECDDLNKDDTDECLSDCTLNPDWGGGSSTGGGGSDSGSGTGGDTGGSSTGDGTTGGGSTTGVTTADPTTGFETTFTTGGAGDSPGTCACTTNRDSGEALGMLGLFMLGLSARRRRRSA